MRGWSFYGTGVRMFGLETEPPDFVTVTHWFTLLFIPFAPLRRLKCRYLGEALEEGQVEPSLMFEIVERLPLSWSSIVSTYLWSWACLLGTIGPLAFLISQTDGRAATTLEMIAGLTLTIALGASPFIVEWRQKRLLEESWRPEKRVAVAEARHAEAEGALNAWQAKHVLSERTFLLSGVVGLVPGVAAAQWWVWPVPLEVAALGGAALAVGLCYVVDRLLMWSKRVSAETRDTDRPDGWA